MGFIVVDDQGKVVASRSEKTKLEPLERRTNASLSYLDSVSLDPGVYEVRLAAVDAEGRRGSVVRDVNAWKMAGEEFTFADLIVNHAATASARACGPTSSRTSMPTASRHTWSSTRASEETFKDVKVEFEIADDDSAPPLLTMPVELRPGVQPTWRNAQGFIGAEPLALGPLCRARENHARRQGGRRARAPVHPRAGAGVEGRPHRHPGGVRARRRRSIATPCCSRRSSTGCSIRLRRSRHHSRAP